MNLLAPFGFYGWGNIGDEATLQGFARLVSRSPHRIRAWVGSRNPAHTSRVEPSFSYFNAAGRDWRRRWAKYRTFGVVFAGGTPIMDGLGDWPLCEVTPLVEDAQRRGQPVAFVGIGTESLHRDESRRMVGDRLGACARHWTVRSSRDQARLIECGVPPERVSIAADMAWLLEPASAEWGKQRLGQWRLANEGRLIGVNLLGEKAVLKREPQLFAKVARFLDALVDEYDGFILFLANEVREGETFDMAAARQTSALMKHRRRTFLAPNDYLAPQQMCSLIANCHATVSMRYHFCLFSALQRVPFIALQRSDKVVDLCADVEWPYGAELNGLDSSRLVGMFSEVEDRRPALVSHLATHRLHVRDRATHNLEALEALRSRQPKAA